MLKGIAMCVKGYSNITVVASTLNLSFPSLRKAFRLFHCINVSSELRLNFWAFGWQFIFVLHCATYVLEFISI